MLVGILCPLIIVLGVLHIVDIPDHQEINSELARPCIRPQNFRPNHSALLASLKCSKWHIPVKEQRVPSLSYLCFILISMSADVELNPGPADFPCGNCAIEVHDDDAAMECDECGLWFHIQCQAIGQDTYDDLVATDQSFSWICSNCDHPNFSTSAQSSFASYASPNNFSILTDEEAEDTNSLSQAPISGIAQHRPSPNKIYNLKVLNINCQSLVNKKAEFQALLDLHKPDIVVGTESWLTKDHYDSEFFPQSLGFTPFREDRVTDTIGGWGLYFN